MPTQTKPGIASVGLAFVALSMNISVFPASAQNANNVEAIETRRVEIERLTIKSSHPFQAVVDALEAGVGRPDMAEFAKAIKNARSYSEIERVVDSSVSQRGLMLFMRFDDGAILQKESGLDKPKIMRFLIGNPLIMKEMTKHVPDAGAYAPVTILVDERPSDIRQDDQSSCAVRKLQRACSRARSRQKDRKSSSRVGRHLGRESVYAAAQCTLR